MGFSYIPLTASDKGNKNKPEKNCFSPTCVQTHERGDSFSVVSARSGAAENYNALLQAKRTEGTVIHEYAHALERSLDLLHNPAFLEIRARGIENAIASDIIK